LIFIFSIYQCSYGNTTAVDLEAKRKLGEVIRTARDSMSQRSFAKELSVSYTTIQLWEKGESLPDIINLINIADRAGYTIEDLLNYLGLKSQPKSSDVNQIVKQIRVMPMSEIGLVLKAIADRIKMDAISESSVDKIKPEVIR
jgi:transcriptional regulator with XRE-family HTH domain